MHTFQKHILVVDDEELVREVIAKKTERHLGYKVSEAVDGLEALKKIELDKPDLIITDIRMPNMDGLELLERVKERGIDVPVIILTGYGQIEDALKAIRLGARGFMKKPFNVEEIVTLIEGTFAMGEEQLDVPDVMPFVRSQTVTVKIPNNYIYLQKVVNFIFHTVRVTWQVGRAELNDLRVASLEALLNGFEHGNLKIDKKKKEECLLKGHIEYQRYLMEQAQLPQNRNTFLTCVLYVDTLKAEVRVIDDGDGFDHSRIYQDFSGLAPEEFMRVHGRGLFLINSLMDEVEFNEKGNMIRFVKYRPRIGGQGEEEAVSYH